MRELKRTTRFLKGTAATLAVQVYEGDTAVTPGGTPAPLVTIVGDDGTVYATAQTATVAGTTATYALTPTQTANVNKLTATWTLETTDGQPVETFVTHHEIVGDHLFSIVDARAYDGAALADETKYSDELVTLWRDGITDAFEGILNHAVGRRFTREVHDGDGTADLLTAADDVQSVRAAATRVGTSWTALTADQLAAVQVYPEGMLYWESGSWVRGRRNVRVDLEYGITPIDWELREAGLRVARYFMVTNDLPDRAIMQITEGGTFQLSVAGRRNAWFGIPAVDAVLARRRTAVVR